jgi:hypothetical protein
MSELLLFPNSWPKNVGAAYTRANTVSHQWLNLLEKIIEQYVNLFVTIAFLIIWHEVLIYNLEAHKLLSKGDCGSRSGRGWELLV